MGIPPPPFHSPLAPPQNHRVMIQMTCTMALVIVDSLGSSGSRFPIRPYLILPKRAPVAQGLRCCTRRGRQGNVVASDGLMDT